LSIEERLRILEDKEAIQEVFHRYVWLLDNRKWDEFTTLFCEDAKFICRPWGEWNGRKEIKDFQLKMFPPERPSGRHMVTNAIIQISGDEAEAKSYFDSASEREGRSMVVGGYYNDKLVKEADGKWRFKEREISFDYNVPLDIGWGGLKGEERIWGDAEGRVRPPADFEYRH